MYKRKGFWIISFEFNFVFNKYGIVTLVTLSLINKIINGIG